MPGTTPVYGFPYPEPTDLVADYPALGQDLAEDIEAVLPTLSGLRLITGAVMNTGATSVNNCFTSTYNYYRIIFWTSTSAGTDIRFRLRVSGADNTTSNYYAAGSRIDTAATVNGTGAAAQTYWPIVSATGSAQATTYSLDIFEPNAANSTVFAGNGAGYAGGVSRYTAETGGGHFSANTVFDGFTVYPGSGTFNGGAVRVYGYKQ